MKEIITSIQNPKIKNLKKLEKASERKAQQLFVVEGLREAVLANRAGYAVHQVFICEELMKPDKNYSPNELLTQQPSPAIYYTNREVYQSLTYRESTEGVIAVVAFKDISLSNLSLRENCLVLVIESVEKPGNLGAMLRTCDAAGVDAVIICDARTDIYNPNVIRSSVGTVFTNSVAVCETKEAIPFLKQKNIIIFAAEPLAEKFHYEQNFRNSTAIIVGTEATGLSEEWMIAADKKIKIPMRGRIDSLNVSVSAGILLFEALRQRETMI